MSRGVYMENQENSFLRMNDRIESKLLEARRVFLSSSVSSESAEEVIRKIWYLALVDSNRPILLIINSPGGSVDAGLAIWDQIQMSAVPVTTLVTGLAASMGSILSLVASKGRRLATPHARIMIHQPSIHGVIEGQATDLDIQAREIVKTRNRLIEIYVEKTGKSFEEIEQALDRDYWMSAEEARDFGLIDQIVSRFDQIDC